jgi:membrane fusion protein (multidrug efflux system)
MSEHGAKIAGIGLSLLLLGGGWVVVFHGDWIRRAPAAEEDEKVETEVPVRTAKVTRTRLRRFVDGYGTVVPAPAHDGRPAAGAKLAAPVAGVLARVDCAEGDHVEKGAVLFQLDVRAASAEEQKAKAAEVSASASLTRLRAVAEYAERERERARKLHHDGLASEKDLHDAELRALSAKNDVAEAQAKAAEAHSALTVAETQRALLDIRAPLAGTVVRIYVNAGEAVDVNPSTVIADLVDLDRLVVSATIPATELPVLHVGQPVELRLAERARDAARPDEAAVAAGPTASGSLAFIGLQVDTRTDTVPVRVTLAPDASLRPGQYLRLRIAVEERADALAVPVESLVAGPEGGRAVAVVEGGKATLRPVEVGLRDRGLVEVRGAGIAEGTTVAVAGAYGLPKETKVRIIEPEGAASAPQPKPGDTGR